MAVILLGERMTRLRWLQFRFGYLRGAFGDRCFPSDLEGNDIALCFRELADLPGLLGGRFHERLLQEAAGQFSLNWACSLAVCLLAQR